MTDPASRRHLGRGRWNRAGSVLLGLGALALAGCATPPRADTERAVRDQVAAVLPAVGQGLDGALAGDAAAAEARVAALRAQPLTPQAAVEIALLRSPRVGAAFARLGLSRADLIGATRLPNPTLGGARLDVDGGGYRTTVDFALGLGDLLLLPARRRLGAAGFAQTQRLVAQEMLNLAVDVETAWYTAVSARQVATMRDAVANAAALSAELAERFFEAGNVTPLQLATERAGASQAKVAAARAAVEARVQRLALLRTIGVDQDPAWALADTLPQPAAPKADEAALLALAQRQRADLDGARREVALLEDALGIARRWRLLGELRLGGEREREPDGEVLSGPTLELALPIFDQGQAGIARATAQLEASRAALRDLELAVGNDVRVALDRWSTAALVVEEYGRTLVPAQQAIVAQQQLRQNFMLIGQFELLLAKQQEYDAWQAYLEAIRDYWIARTDLQRAIGGALPGTEAAGAPAIGPQDLPGMPAEPDLDRKRQPPAGPAAAAGTERKESEP
jgi:cobalt-zinc-cadmium efflux system outer membrane protein